MKIDNIHVLNFKSFKELDLDLKNINIILGHNNSGKSNILRLLLLLKQTFTSNLESPLILNGNIISLGTFKDISYMFETNKLNINYKVSNPYEILFHFGEDYEIDEKLEEDIFNIKSEYELDFKLNKGNLSSIYIKNLSKKIPYLIYSKNQEVKLNNQTLDSFSSNFLKIINKIINILKNCPEINFTSRKSLYKGLSTIAKDLNLKIVFPDLQPLLNYYLKYFESLAQKVDLITLDVQGKFPRLNYNFDSFDSDYRSFDRFVRYWRAPYIKNNLTNYVSNNCIDDVNSFTKGLNSSLRTLIDFEDYLSSSRETLENLRENFSYTFDHLYYIGPLRKYPQRYYSLTYETASDVGYQGEFFPHILKESIEKDYLKKVFERVSFWLKKFEMAKKTDIKKYDEIQEFLSIIFEEYFSGVNVNLTDMGVGTSQILPIIIEGFFIKENSVLLIEQPEIHLHPKAQATLGDLFIEIAAENKILVIETHSEHLIQRIQRRIAEGTIKNEDVAFYYIKMSEEGSKIQNLIINEDGYIENIPDGFFDEDYREAYKHIKTVLEKKISKNKLQ